MQIKITRPFAFAHRGVEVVQYDESSTDVPDDVAEWAVANEYAERASAPAENKDAARTPRTVKRNARA